MSLLKNQLHILSYEGDIDVVKKILRRNKTLNLNAQDKNGWTPLHCASHAGNLGICKLLIGAGADVCAKNNDGASSLHYLARMQDLSPKQKKVYLDVLKQLLRKGAPVNAQNVHGESPLHQACMKQSVVAVEFLLKNKASVNLRNTFGETSLHYAVRTGNQPIINLLLEAGADVNLPGTLDGTPVDLAEKYKAKEIANLLKSSKTYDASKHGAEAMKAAPSTSQANLIGRKPTISPATEDGATAKPAAPAKAPGEEGADDSADSLQNAFTRWEAKLMHTWEINGKELDFQRKLGEGTSAKVFLGKYRGQDVAIKVLKESNSPDSKQMEDFEKEFEIMSSLKSPHVVLFFGACIKPRLCMVFEFCHKGALYDVLNSTTETIDWKRMLSICQGMGKAVNTLHNWKPTIVHRDLKSLNLLVDENFTIKVCDFGLSRFATGAANLSTLGKLRGTYAYSAPEVYFGEPFTVKADVFSVGIILWEMVYRVMVGKYAMPYSEYPRLVFDFQIIIQVAKHKLRPTIPAGCPEILADLIRSCWDQEPKKRPTMVGFMAKIDEAAKQFKDHKSEWNALIPKRDAKADVKPEVKHDAPKDGKEEVEEVKPNPLPKETLKEPDAAELAALNEGREKPKDEDVSDDSEEDSVVKPGEESSDEFDV